MITKTYDLGHGYQLVLIEDDKLGEIARLSRDGTPLWVGKTAELRRVLKEVA